MKVIEHTTPRAIAAFWRRWEIAARAHYHVWGAAKHTYNGVA